MITTQTKKTIGTTITLVASILLLILLTSVSGQADAPFSMTFIGHDSFAFNSADGTVVVCDPYQPYSIGSGIPQFPVGYRADVVTVSHTHSDHDFIGGIAGSPQILRKPGVFTYGDLTLTIYQGFEGKPEGLSAMKNLICVFERDGIKVVHLGDSGIVIDPVILAGISDADAVIVNIDDYVIPHGKIMPFMALIRARTVVPAHWESLKQLAQFIDGNAKDILVTQGDNVFPLKKNSAKQILIMAPMGYAMPKR